MSTYLELVQDLHRDCNVGGTAPTSGNFASLTGTVARLKDWVKQADLELKSKWFNWKFLWASGSVSLVASTQDYTGPSDLGIYDKNTFLLDGYPIQVIEYREYKEKSLLGVADEGTPVVIVILPNNSLRCYPIPDAAQTLTFEYYKAATASVLSAHGDTSVIPAQFHRAIFYTAMTYYANWDNADELKKQAVEGLYGRNGTLEEGWIHKLETHQLPSSGYAGATNDGNYEIQVIPE